MKYILMAAALILTGCADYPFDAGYSDDSYWQLREIQREQEQAEINQRFEQNQLRQIQMDQQLFNHYRFH